MGGANGLLFILSGHFNCLTDEWQLLAGDHMVVDRTVNGCEWTGYIITLTHEFTRMQEIIYG